MDADKKLSWGDRRAAASAERKRLKSVRGKPVAVFFPFTLYSEGWVEKATGDDRGCFSLEGATVELGSGSELESRFTAARFVMLGVFALAFKKKRGGEQFLAFLGDDFQWLEEVPRKKVGAATKFFHQVRGVQQKKGWL